MYRREAQPLHKGPRAKLPEHFEHAASFAKRSLLSVSYAFAGYPMFEKEIWFKTLSAGMKNRRTFKTAAVYVYSPLYAWNFNSIFLQVGIMFLTGLCIINRAVLRAEIEHIPILGFRGRMDRRIDRGTTGITDRSGRQPLAGTVISVICITVGRITAV